MRAAGLVVLLFCAAGCSRTWYRLDADAETYRAVDEKLSDPRWQLPEQGLDRPVESRLHDSTNPDRPPMPPDDPAAHLFMHEADGHRGWKHWHRNGDLANVEFPEWRKYLPLEPDGTLKLTPEGAVRLALLHSREYQTQSEDLFLVALALTLNRFEFALQWFATNNTTYEHFGASSVPTETNTLTNTTAVGFTKAFTAGGQLLVNLINSFTWEYTGGTSSVNTNFTAAFIQPFLRGAGRQVRMEGLTQGERNLLYAVRAFARFRKEFYFTVAIEQYQALLQATQEIRNLEGNVKTREQQYLVIAARRAAGEASLAQEDQAFSSFQQARIQLVQAKTNLENQFDAYKLLLGLPPDVRIRIDDSILKVFDFATPELRAFQEKTTEYMNTIAGRDAPPPVAGLREDYVQLARLTKTTETFAKQMREDVVKVKARTAANPLPDKQAEQRRQAGVDMLDKQSLELLDDLVKFAREIDRKAGTLTEAGRAASQSDVWRKARDLTNLVGQVYALQAEARIRLLELPEFNPEEQSSITFALAERLDLMNRRAQVVDAWRQIEVAADRLQGVLNLQADMNLATKADNDTPLDFAAQASRYRIGVQVEGPLNRQVERNLYRLAQINYQRARRDYMAAEDNIVRTIRQDVRQLNTDRLNFDLNRQLLVAKARQIEENQYQLLFGDRGDVQNGTTAILTALDDLLDAQNALIAQWFSFERGRLRLLLDTEQLQLDDDGIYRDATRLPLAAAGQAGLQPVPPRPAHGVPGQPGPGQPPAPRPPP
jgi:outer membrane protein TolC